MAYNIEAIHVKKGAIVRELFVDTADDNYITARWCFVEKLYVDYFWLAVHALEKYMKAVLLLNGRSSKSYCDQAGKNRIFKHDILGLYSQVKLLASDLLPRNLQRPDELDTDRWRDENPETFLQRLYDHGNPDNRYQIFGLYRRDEDLFKLDQMVFALRRLCVPLDAYYLGSWLAENESLTHRDRLLRQYDCWAVSLQCKLEKTANGERGKRLRHVLLNFNLPFAPKDFPHGRLRTGMAVQNPVLVRSILRPLEEAPESQAAAVAAEVCDWVLANIQLPNDVKEQLREARTKLR